jgi:UDP-N-acetylmuramate--alanine ligase
MMFGPIKQIHFVGIGGTGMSGIAEILLNLDFVVSGSDLLASQATDYLSKLGADVMIGHNGRLVEGVDAVVVSAAVPDDNPEVIRARELKIPVISRAEMLAELMRLKRGVAVAGTHGKTTTTSMVASVLEAGGVDPTVVVGGRVKGFGSGARTGNGDYLVVEADEFDRSFLKLSPTIAIVTTIEAEHLDCYRDLDEIKAAFVEFVNRVPFYGAVIVCLDEESVQSIIPRVERRLITYGVSSQADLRAIEVMHRGREGRYVLSVRGEEVGEIKLSVPGLHNIRNSLAAAAVGIELGIDHRKIANALAGFTGVHRRFEIKGEVEGIMVVDDYAHHPTEIEVTLRAAKDGWGRRIVAVFQPHLYTRTRDFHVEFGKSFFQADVLIVTDIYPAREKPIEGVTGELVARAAREYGHRDVTYIPDASDIPPYLRKVTKRGDLVITLGAGDIWEKGEAFHRLISRASGKGKRIRKKR